MRVARHPEVAQELEAAAIWYEERQSGLGAAFLEEYKHTVDQILAAPERWRRLRGENRKLNLHRFPYAVVYSIHSDAIYIKAVMHLHRRPYYWKDRI